MSRLPDEFVADRALRDAARRVLVADFDHARESLSGKAVAGRLADRVSLGAKTLMDVGKDSVSANKSLYAGIVTLIALWFAREPILDALALALDDDDTDEGDAEGESPNPDASDHAEEAETRL
ncbi:MAG: hypothetical protein V2J14_10105 [Erythrobacter sp.]|jgi:hypothetical protein|nr:hypothetical protein [Erythrobacter sp.]